MPQPVGPGNREAYKRDDADQMLALKLASLIGGEGEHLNGIIGAAESRPGLGGRPGNGCRCVPRSR